MSDRRRLNGPTGGTRAPVFDQHSFTTSTIPVARSRKPNEPRKIFLRTGLIPAANGSSYLEIERQKTLPRTFLSTSSTLKLVCSVYGPKPLSRSSTFSPNLQVTSSVKFAPFASHHRHGYVRESTERDLSTHLENALKGVIISDRWPKSSIDIAVTVLEFEEACLGLGEDRKTSSSSDLTMLTMLSGCITAATAALANASIDCLDLLAGGIAAVVPAANSTITHIIDPDPAEHEEILAACMVGYLPSRDEVTEIWTQGGTPLKNRDGQVDFERLLDNAIMAARISHSVLKEVLIETL